MADDKSITSPLAWHNGGLYWPTKMLPPPVTTLQISKLELHTLIASHEYTAKIHGGEQGEYHQIRASYLRHRLAELTIAPGPPA